MKAHGNVEKSYPPIEDLHQRDVEICGDEAPYVVRRCRGNCSTVQTCSPHHITDQVPLELMKDKNHIFLFCAEFHKHPYGSGPYEKMTCAIIMPYTSECWIVYAGNWLDLSSPTYNINGLMWCFCSSRASRPALSNVSVQDIIQHLRYPSLNSIYAGEPVGSKLTNLQY